MESLGSRIKTLRKQKGLTQDQLAEVIGVKSGVTISNYEKSERNPDIEIVKKLAAFFEVTADFILNGESTINQINEPKHVYIAQNGDLVAKIKEAIPHLLNTNQHSQVALLGFILVEIEGLLAKNAEMQKELQEVSKQKEELQGIVERLTGSSCV